MKIIFAFGFKFSSPVYDHGRFEGQPDGVPQNVDTAGDKAGELPACPRPTISQIWPSDGVSLDEEYNDAGELSACKLFLLIQITGPDLQESGSLRCIAR